MIKLLTKEHLVYFMQSGMMKLSNYDLSFIQNLHHMVTQQKGITTNQVALLDKIIDKYKRQFNKQKFTLEFLKSLPWENNVIESDPQFTEAFVSIEDDVLYFKSPFNKKFISELRALPLNPFKWNRDTKRYEGKFDTLALRIMHKLGTKHFPKVNYCSVSSALINKIEEFKDVKYWEPTLTSINNNLYIVAANEFVYEATKNIKLDINIKTIANLAEYGVKCSHELSKDKKIHFASNFISEVELPNLQEIIPWLAEIGCDVVYFLGITHTHTRKDIFDKFTEQGIACHAHREFVFLGKDREKVYNYPVLIQFFSNVNTESKIDALDIKKIIKVSNPYPIKIHK